LYESYNPPTACIYDFVNIAYSTDWKTPNILSQSFTDTVVSVTLVSKYTVLVMRALY